MLRLALASTLWQWSPESRAAAVRLDEDDIAAVVDDVREWITNEPASPPHSLHQGAAAGASRQAHGGKEQSSPDGFSASARKSFQQAEGAVTGEFNTLASQVQAGTHRAAAALGGLASSAEKMISSGVQDAGAEGKSKKAQDGRSEVVLQPTVGSLAMERTTEAFDQQMLSDIPALTEVNSQTALLEPDGDKPMSVPALVASSLVDLDTLPATDTSMGLLEEGQEEGRTRPAAAKKADGLATGEAPLSGRSQPQITFNIIGTERMPFVAKAAEHGGRMVSGVLKHAKAAAADHAAAVKGLSTMAQRSQVAEERRKALETEVRAAEQEGNVRNYQAIKESNDRRKATQQEHHQRQKIQQQNKEQEVQRGKSRMAAHEQSQQRLQTQHHQEQVHQHKQGQQHSERAQASSRSGSKQAGQRAGDHALKQKAEASSEQTEASVLKEVLRREQLRRLHAWQEEHQHDYDGGSSDYAADEAAAQDGKPESVHQQRGPAAAMQALAGKTMEAMRHAAMALPSGEMRLHQAASPKPKGTKPERVSADPADTATAAPPIAATNAPTEASKEASESKEEAKDAEEATKEADDGGSAEPSASGQEKAKAEASKEKEADPNAPPEGGWPPEELSFDCDIEAESQWEFAWSSRKINWCCKNKNVACETNRFQVLPKQSCITEYEQQEPTLQMCMDRCKEEGCNVLSRPAGTAPDEEASCWTSIGTLEQGCDDQIFKRVTKSEVSDPYNPFVKLPKKSCVTPEKVYFFTLPECVSRCAEKNCRYFSRNASLAPYEPGECWLTTTGKTDGDCKEFIYESAPARIEREIEDAQEKLAALKKAVKTIQTQIDTLETEETTAQKAEEKSEANLTAAEGEKKEKGKEVKSTETKIQKVTKQMQEKARAAKNITEELTDAKAEEDAAEDTAKVMDAGLKMSKAVLQKAEQRKAALLKDLKKAKQDDARATEAVGATDKQEKDLEAEDAKSLKKQHAAERAVQDKQKKKADENEAAAAFEHTVADAKKHLHDAVRARDEAATGEKQSKESEVAHIKALTGAKKAVDSSIIREKALFDDAERQKAQLRADVKVANEETVKMRQYVQQAEDLAKHAKDEATKHKAAEKVRREAEESENFERTVVNKAVSELQKLPAKQFDCDEDYDGDAWKWSWSTLKLDYCCKTRNQGCAEPLLIPLEPETTTATTTTTTTTTLPPPTTSTATTTPQCSTTGAAAPCAAATTAAAPCAAATTVAAPCGAATTAAAPCGVVTTTHGSPSAAAPCTVAAVDAATHEGHEGPPPHGSAPANGGAHAHEHGGNTTGGKNKELHYSPEAVARDFGSDTHLVPEAMCSAWTPSSGPLKGKGGSCQHWGWQTTWCYVQKDCVGRFKHFCNRAVPSEFYHGKFFAHCTPGKSLMHHGEASSASKPETSTNWWSEAANEVNRWMGEDVSQVARDVVSGGFSG
eukprot:TRINITY_DN18726_c0_g1_i1.p1 TRINITY_DN18726_c0_g1~~TRINITY_DN18726_c0_g1_i1.p1  ORF type:complete len:1441 (-),score=511.93 TRINITY_DN18726_c0_g1_i1:84-4406(-)